MHRGIQESSVSMEKKIDPLSRLVKKTKLSWETQRLIKIAKREERESLLKEINYLKRTVGLKDKIIRELEQEIIIQRGYVDILNGTKVPTKDRKPRWGIQYGSVIVKRRFDTYQEALEWGRWNYKGQMNNWMITDFDSL